MNEQTYTQFMLPVGTMLQNGKYRIDRYLSSGGFGNTYVATNVYFDEQVAIKEFFMRGISDRNSDSVTVSVSIPTNQVQFNGQREKFKKEAFRLRKLKNEHIVGVHDLFEENGTSYYVMDYIEGESVSARLKRTGEPLSEPEALEILDQILDALTVVHNQGFYHLDIKPANIMVNREGRAVLIDFGASKQTKQDGGATTSTGLCYTPGYAPIEQMAQNPNQFGPWTDIYSLGASLYYMLTLHSLPSPVDLIEDENLLQMDGVSKKTQMLIHRMMMPVRTKRPQSTAEVKALLETPQASEETIAVAPPMPQVEETQILETPLPSSASVEESVSPPETGIEVDDDEFQTEPQKQSWLIGLIAGICVLVVVILIALLLVPRLSGTSDNSSMTEDPSAIPMNNSIVGADTIHIESYKTNVGVCRYIGLVDANGKPDGNGVAEFTDGRRYEGAFKDGKMSGYGKFTLASGDVFEGEMKDDFFYKGRYTMTDGSYFDGTFEKGKTKQGSWYDKNGRKI